jgi:predicted DNA-binding protein (MmcQ/YjbR family)
MEYSKMDIDELRKFCLSFPHATEDVKWGSDLAFCVGEKMFAVTNLETAAASLSLKCTPEKFAELIELDGIVPAQYVARYHWVTLQKTDALKTAELKELIGESYKMVWEKLPKRLKKHLNSE